MLKHRIGLFPAGNIDKRPVDAFWIAQISHHIIERHEKAAIEARPIAGVASLLNAPLENTMGPRTKATVGIKVFVFIGIN